MKTLVLGERGTFVTGIEVSLHLGERVFSRRQILFVHARNSFANRMLLENHTRFVDIPHVRYRDFGYPSTAVRLRHHQAFGLEPLQCFADGNEAQAVLLRQSRKD